MCVQAAAKKLQPTLIWAKEAYCIPQPLQLRMGRGPRSLQSIPVFAGGSWGNPTGVVAAGRPLGTTGVGVKDQRRKDVGLSDGAPADLWLVACGSRHSVAGWVSALCLLLPSQVMKCRSQN